MDREAELVSSEPRVPTDWAALARCVQIAIKTEVNRPDIHDCKGQIFQLLPKKCGLDN